MLALRSLKIALMVAIAAFATAAIHISIAIGERQEALRQLSRYNIVWAASQSLSEIENFQVLVSQLGRRPELLDKDQLALKLDILFNRLDVLNGGNFKPFLQAKPHHRKALEALAAALAAVEERLPRLHEPQVQDAVFDLLTAPEQLLTRFAAATNQYAGEMMAEDQQHLLRLHATFSLLTSGLVGCGVVFVALLFWQNRVLGQTRDRLRHLTVELREAKDRAEAASEAKSRFLATMSHELRTPLNAVIGFSELILQEPFGPAGHPKYVEYLKDIDRSGRHMLELVTDILTAARMDAGRLELEFTSVSARVLVDTVLRTIQGTELGRERNIEVEAIGGWPSLIADERAMRQVLLNLLSNAIKFSPADQPITLCSALSPDGHYTLSVRDRGIGMKAEEVALATQPFFQADARLSRKYGGTGLGLSIVKGLIEQHGGNLRIDSRPELGTTVSIALPPERVERVTLGIAA